MGGVHPLPTLPCPLYHGGLGVGPSVLTLFGHAQQISASQLIINMLTCKVI